MTASFTCSICGEAHEGLPTDYAYRLPDDVWAIPEQEREARAQWSTDLCQFGGRFFIRCILFVPFTERPGEFGWGVWAEVPEAVFQRYLQVYEHDATGEPEATGVLANKVPAYPQIVGVPVRIQFRSSMERPTLRFPPGAGHVFAREQGQGINEALDACVTRGERGAHLHPMRGQFTQQFLEFDRQFRARIQISQYSP